MRHYICNFTGRVVGETSRLFFSKSAQKFETMIRIISFLILTGLFLSCQPKKEETISGKPTVFIIGDSTVKNGRGDGAGGLWGWGDPIVQYFDTSKIAIENHALDGTSSRTFRSKGLWDEVLRRIQPGDYVLVQFGHNENKPVNDTIQACGTIHGIGEETEEIDNRLTGEHEIVHTYGWYIRQCIIEAKEKGAIPVVISPVPQNDWENRRVLRDNESYGKWTREVADFEEVQFIDLNEKMAVAMEERGEGNVTGTLFLEHDHAHTTAKGAALAASLVIEGLRQSENCWLKDFLLEAPEINFPVKKNVYILGDSMVADGDGKVAGWGNELATFFDTTRVNIINKASANHGIRSYQEEGLWDEVLADLKEGDFLLVQFGHNDGNEPGAPKYRALPGSGDETGQATPNDSITETVHTYGWYMKKYIADAKAKGVSVIVLSPAPRNEWLDGKVERVDETYGKWAKEAAITEGAFFIDMNDAVAIEYEAMGPQIVKAFFTGDHSHTNVAGARLNALILARQIKDLTDCKLYGYVELEKL